MCALAGSGAGAPPVQYQRIIGFVSCLEPKTSFTRKTWANKVAVETWASELLRQWNWDWQVRPPTSRLADLEIKYCSILSDQGDENLREKNNLKLIILHAEFISKKYILILNYLKWFSFVLKSLIGVDIANKARCIPRTSTSRGTLSTSFQRE